MAIREQQIEGRMTAPTKAEQMLLDIAQIVQPHQDDDAIDHAIMVSGVRRILEAEQEYMLALIKGKS